MGRQTGVATSYEDLPAYLTVKELQIYLRISRNQAYALARRPDFPKVLDGSKKIFPKAQVAEWVEANNYFGRTPSKTSDRRRL
jgi:predicted DNA-binding transcriptional regulator AlpA